MKALSLEHVLIFRYVECQTVSSAENQYNDDQASLFRKKNFSPFFSFSRYLQPV
jgi:hypothetical protein